MPGKPLQDVGLGGVELGQWRVQLAQPVVGLGQQVLPLERRPALGHRVQDLVGQVVQPGTGQRAVLRRARGQGGGEHPVHRVVPAQGGRRLGTPRGPLLGQTAGLLLGLAGLQGGLLRQREGLLRGRCPAVGRLERGGQVVSPYVDLGPAGRPRCQQRVVDADDLPHLAATVTVPVSGREPDAEALGDPTLQQGVVPLRRGDHGPVEHLPVQRQPGPVQSLDLVGHRDVGVQVRVPGAGVAVHERRRHEPFDVDLPDPVGAAAGEGDLPLQPRQSVLHRLPVHPLDPLRDLAGSQGPQRADTLDGGEGQVEPSHRLPTRAAHRDQVRRQLPTVAGLPAVQLGERLPTDAGADRRAYLVRDTPSPRLPMLDQPVPVGPGDPDDELARLGVVLPERGTQPGRSLRVAARRTARQLVPDDPCSVRVSALTEQRHHLRLGHGVTHADGLQRLKPRAEPSSR